MFRRSRFGLTLALGLLSHTATAGAAPRAEFVGSYHWTQKSPLFGGFSGLDLAPDGDSFLTVSDSGATVAGRLLRDGDGRVTGVEAGEPVPLRDRDGAVVKPPRDDSEGLALDPAGGFYVSFETVDRINHYAGQDAVPDAQIRAEVFAGFELNGGLEPLAIAPDGALYALPERKFGGQPDYPVYRHAGGRWSQPFRLRGDGDWLPVGADFGPDGRLYLLERDYWMFLGFMSRVRRITLAGNKVTADEVILETRAGTHDNLEGLAVWQDAGGAIRLTMISDDNFLPLQRTEIVDYRVTE